MNPPKRALWLEKGYIQCMYNIIITVYLCCPHENRPCERRFFKHVDLTAKLDPTLDEGRMEGMLTFLEVSFCHTGEAPGL